MKLLKILLVALAVPLGACAAIQGAGIGDPDGFEDLPEVYNVFFGFDTAELDEAGEAIVIQAAADAMQFSPGSIQISGFPDPAPGEATAGLAEQRFVVVENLMATQGCPSSKILEQVSGLSNGGSGSSWVSI
jgi:outer membrane protein OmpA-like peptidoglycan-associated protein